MKTLLLSFVLLLVIGCSDKKYHEKANSTLPKYSLENILNYNNEDTIFVKSRFSDCGEWGGHSELIKIYRAEKKLKLTYIKFKVDCDMRDSEGSIIQNKEFTRHVLLSNSQQLALMNYMNDLMKFQFLTKEISHSGNSFYLYNTKEDLKIYHYGNQPLLLNNYNILMTEFGFPTVIVDSK